MIDFTKLSKISYKLFYSLFIIFFSWIFILNIGVNALTKPIIFLFFALLLTGVIFLKKKMENIVDLSVHESKLTKFIKIELWILLFFLVSIVGLSLRVTPSWDYDAVHRYALEWVRNGEIENVSYFARYPNNNLILIIITIFYKIVDVIFPNSSDIFFIKASIIFNSVLVTLSIYLTSLSAQKMYGKRFKSINILFLILFTPILLYTEILYTDTVGIFFVSLITLILVSKIDDFKTIDGITLGLLFAIGYKIKAFIIIMLVALIIILFLKNKLRFRNKLILISVTILSFLFSSLLIGSMLDKSIGLNKELYDQYQFPTSHWIMMSLNPDNEGGFNQKDYEETRDTDGKKNKDLLINKKLTERVNTLGTYGIIEHNFYKKMKRTWTTGSMGIDDYANRGNVHNSFMQDFFTNNGKNHFIYYIFSQTTHLLLIFLMLTSGLISFFKQRDDINILNISIFGIMLFLIIWECNSRYLFSFIPLFSLVSLQFLANNYKPKI